MSRIGKQELLIPDGVTVTLTDSVVLVKGKSGELKRKVDDSKVEIKIEEGKVTFATRRNDKPTRALWGTYASIIKSMIKGVQQPYSRTLLMEGVGYKWEVKGKQIQFALGFSHPVFLDIPEGLTVAIDKFTMTITGIDKEKVGSFAKLIRSQKEPEPYKGKGIRYSDEVIRRKQGKRSA
jgi:large subunit ribosomal protein L6